MDGWQTQKMFQYQLMTPKEMEQALRQAAVAPPKNLLDLITPEQTEKARIKYNDPFVIMVHKPLFDRALPFPSIRQRLHCQFFYAMAQFIRARMAKHIPNHRWPAPKPDTPIMEHLLDVLSWLGSALTRLRYGLPKHLQPSIRAELYEIDVELMCYCKNEFPHSGPDSNIALLLARHLMPAIHDLRDMACSRGT